MQTIFDTHPLQTTFERVSQLSPYIRACLGPPQEDDWIAPAAFLAPDSTQLDAMIAATQRRLRTQTANVVGGSILQEYQWPLIASAVACYLCDRRVPNLRIENVRLRISIEDETEEKGEEKEPQERIAFLGGRFFALPDDPAADHPDACIVPHPDALREELRAGIETHLGSTIQRLHERLGCSPRGLWLFVADRCVGTLSWLMQEQDHTATLCQIEAEVDALIRTPGSPLANKRVGLFELAYQDRRRVYLDRATCCYWYRSEGGDYCTTCPHRTEEDRNARLLHYLAEKVAQ